MSQVATPVVSNVTARVLGVLVIALNSAGLPMFNYIGEASGSPLLPVQEQQEQKPTTPTSNQPVIAITPDKPARRKRRTKAEIAADKAAAEQPKSPPAAPISEVLEPEAEPEVDEVETVETESKASTGRRGKGGSKASSGSSSAAPSSSKFQGKPMVPKLKSALGARRGMIRTKKGKEMEVWVLEESTKGYVVLNPDKKSDCPKGYLFGCCWTVKPENFIKYL